MRHLAQALLGRLEILELMRLEKSPRPDYIYTRMIWEAKEVIAGIMTEISVSLFATNKILNSWKWRRR